MIIKFNTHKIFFKNEILYQLPYVFKKCFNNSEFSWQNVNEIYSRADISHRDFKLMDGYEVAKSEYLETFDNLGVIESRFITSNLYKYLRNGATLVRNRIRNEPIIDDISRQIGSFAEARTITSSYSAFSSKSSYKSHWDTRDVFAVQLLGRKRWILKKPNFEFPLYMQQSKNFPKLQEPEEIYMDIVLEAGDILYIPRGWWHDPLPLDEETFHLAVATFAPTGYEYLQWLKNVTPNILDCRKNFKSFEDDKETLENISNRMMNIIKNKKIYEQFMMHHLENHDVTSPLSLNILGNNKVNKLPLTQKVCLNANLLFLFEDNFLIINGNKINIDAISLELITYLFEHPYSTIKKIFNNFRDIPLDKIENLLFQLALENIIGLVDN